MDFQVGKAHKSAIACTKRTSMLTLSMSAFRKWTSLIRSPMSANDP